MKCTKDKARIRPVRKVNAREMGKHGEFYSGLIPLVHSSPFLLGENSLSIFNQTQSEPILSFDHQIGLKIVSLFTRNILLITLSLSTSIITNGV